MDGVSIDQQRQLQKQREERRRAAAAKNAEVRSSDDRSRCLVKICNARMIWSICWWNYVSSGR